MIKGQPCKVSDVSTSKTGKHGHAKCNFTAINIFTGKKLEDIVPSTHNTTVPIVVRKEYQLLDIGEDDYVTLMDEAGEQRTDIKMPPSDDDLIKTIEKNFEGDENVMVTVQSAMNIDQIVACKIETSKD